MSNHSFKPNHIRELHWKDGDATHCVRIAEDEAGTPWVVTEDLWTPAGRVRNSARLREISVTAKAKARVGTKGGKQALLVLTVEAALGLLNKLGTEGAIGLAVWLGEQFGIEVEVQNSPAVDEALPDLTVFTYQGNPLRAFAEEGGDVWFLADDLAQILGYGRTIDMLRNAEEDGTRKQGKTTLLNEVGLRSCVYRSRRAKATQVRGWLNAEVFPSLLNNTHGPSAHQASGSTPAIFTPDFSFNGIPIQAHIDDDDKVWLQAKGVCDALGYSRYWDAISKHCRPSGVRKVSARDSAVRNFIHFTHDINRDDPCTGDFAHTIYINEGNLYRLIMRSRLPQAEAFEIKVCDEILPAIRKTGRYIAGESDSGSPSQASPSQPTGRTLPFYVEFSQYKLEVVDRHGQPWFRELQIGKALGYANPSTAMRQLYQKSVSLLGREVDVDGVEERRIYSLQGVRLVLAQSKAANARLLALWTNNMQDVFDASGTLPGVGEAQAELISPLAENREPEGSVPLPVATVRTDKSYDALWREGEYLFMSQERNPSVIGKAHAMNTYPDELGDAFDITFALFGDDRNRRLALAAWGTLPWSWESRKGSLTEDDRELVLRMMREADLYRTVHRPQARKYHRKSFPRFLEQFMPGDIGIHQLAGPSITPANPKALEQAFSVMQSDPDQAPAYARKMAQLYKALSAKQAEVADIFEQIADTPA